MPKPSIAVLVAEKMKGKGEGKPKDSEGGTDFARMAKDLIEAVKSDDAKLVEAILKALKG